tara:strand:- start:149 stop:676 length:528 start_codon:yes stop_codon:yes gene_type:complete
MAQKSDLEAYFRTNNKRLIHKWSHYFDIYEKHFAKYRNTNGYLDHGFYQFSPTLFTDYYKANKYEAINGTLIDRASLGSVRLAPYRFDIYRKESPKYIRDRHSFTLSFFCFEKKTNSTSNEIPIQTFYSSMHSDFEQNYEFKHTYNKVLNSYKHKLLGLLPSRLKKRIISLLKNK